MDGFDYFRLACSRDPEPYKVGRNGKYQCPCCGYFTLDGCSRYDICPVCFWEDDGAVKDDDFGGPNHMTLGEGRQLYRTHGYTSTEERFKDLVRSPLPDEI